MWITLVCDRGRVVVKNEVQKLEKLGGKVGIFTSFAKLLNIFTKKFAKNTQSFEGVFAQLFHIFCDIKQLSIDFFLDFFDLITEGEVEFEVLLNLANTMNYGGVVLYANFGGDFIGTKF